MRGHGLAWFGSYRDRELLWMCTCGRYCETPEELVDHMCGMRHKHHVERYRQVLRELVQVKRELKERDN
jgi:hypothetical protein